MPNAIKYEPSKQPRRPHHIQDWAERLGYRQTDLCNALGVQKSLVSRWYAGATPSVQWQKALAILFGCSIEALFRHPDEDWLVRFCAERTEQEIQRIKATLEAAFPRSEQ